MWHPLHLHRLRATIWPDPGPGCYYYHHQAGGWMEDHHTASHRRVIVHAQTFTSPQPHSARAEHDSTQDTLTIISLVTSNLPSIPTLFMRHALRTLTAHRKHCPDLSHFNKNLCWYQTTRQGLWGQLQRKERKSVANFKPAIFIKLDSHGSMSGRGSSTKKLFIVA